MPSLYDSLGMGVAGPTLLGPILPEKRPDFIGLEEPYYKALTESRSRFGQMLQGEKPDYSTRISEAEKAGGLSADLKATFEIPVKSITNQFAAVAK